MLNEIKIKASYLKINNEIDLYKSELSKLDKLIKLTQTEEKETLAAEKEILKQEKEDRINSILQKSELKEKRILKNTMKKKKNIEKHNAKEKKNIINKNINKNPITC